MTKLFLECKETVYQIGTLDDNTDMSEMMSDSPDISFNDIREFSPIFLFRNEILGAREVDVDGDFSDLDYAHLIIVVYSDGDKGKYDWEAVDACRTRRQAKSLSESILTGGYKAGEPQAWDKDDNELESIEIIYLPIED